VWGQGNRGVLSESAGESWGWGNAGELRAGRIGGGAAAGARGGGIGVNWAGMRSR
jgi:hypothetical protein